MSAVEASLTRLKTDYIDLYQQHDYDPADADGRDAARARRSRAPGQGPLHRQFELSGLADRRSGTDGAADERQPLRLLPGRIQPAWCAASRRTCCRRATEYRLGLLPFFPLASGLLTGKYKRGAAAPDDTRFAKAPALKDRYVTARNEDIVEKLQAFAQARGHTMLELAFSWLAARPQVSSVIAGATRVEQVEQNVKAIGWTLSAEEMAEVDGITK